MRVSKPKPGELFYHRCTNSLEIFVGHDLNTRTWIVWNISTMSLFNLSGPFSSLVELRDQLWPTPYWEQINQLDDG